MEQFALVYTPPGPGAPRIVHSGVHTPPKSSTCTDDEVKVAVQRRARWRRSRTSRTVCGNIDVRRNWSDRRGSACNRRPRHQDREVTDILPDVRRIYDKICDYYVESASPGGDCGRGVLWLAPEPSPKM